MSWYWIGSAIGLALAGLLFVWSSTELGRFAKTVLLIARVSPYEQSGNGAGRILVVGDSTGYGTGATRAADSVAGRIGAAYPDYQIENRSKNADTIAAALARVEDVIGTYDLIVLQLGGNDIMQQRDIATITDHVMAMYTRLRPHANHFVMVSAGNVGGAAAFTGTEAAVLTRHSRAYHAALEAFAATRSDFTYVSLFDELENDPFVAAPHVYLASDGLHPSSAGYKLWFEKIIPIIDTQLSK